MKGSSRTALGIAAARALERERPPAERIVDDPFARHFVGESLYRVMTAFDRIGWSERRGPGVMGYLVARERAIDDCLRQMVDEGIDQLVILGAGFDARAYRFARRLAGVRVFEVDHPTTQAEKKHKVQKFIDEVTVDVEFVPVDFDSQSLGDEMKRHGYDPSLRTFFVWQGVMMYLAPDAIDATLAFVRQQSGPGSSIVLDYVALSAIDGPGARPEVRKTNMYGRMTGERIRFGLDPEVAAGWLRDRGFREVQHTRSSELHSRYFHGPSASRQVADGYGILFGRTPK